MEAQIVCVSDKSIFTFQGRLSPPRLWKQSPPPPQNYGLSNPLLKNSDFFSVMPITIRYRKLFGLDAFYEIMIRQEWIWQFWLGGVKLLGGVGVLPQKILRCQVLSDEF